MGISKRELLENYYMDEIFEVIEEYNDMHRVEKPEEEVEVVDSQGFFGF